MTHPTPEAPVEHTTDQRKYVLATGVNTYAANGWRVESQADFNAVIVKGKRPNHILHLILSVLTLGAWVLVWIVLAVVMHEKRRALSVDQYGIVRVA